jgi:RNA polymerase sigma-70 factor (ECF subfamily)
VNAEPASDRADFQQLQLDDDRALDRLIARWQRRLHAFAWRYLQSDADARDAVEEVFVRLYRERQRLRPDTHVRAWLFTALANACHNRHRWRRRHPTQSLESPTADEIPAPSPDAATSIPLAHLEHDEALAALAAAIARLPHDWKSAVLLHHYEGWSYAEIAAASGCSPRGVETRLYRAREQLRRELAPLAPDEAGKPLTASAPPWR